MNGGLSKLGTALTVVFAVTLLALVAQLFYLLWRRTSLAECDGESVPAGDPSQCNSLTSSHGLFRNFLFCWKAKSRIEPQEAHHPQQPNNEGDVDELLKWQQGLYGLSRELFTIAEEEEREGLDSEEKEPKTTTTSLKKCYGVTAAVTVMVEMDVDDGTTPFSTPCASPPYYTPSPSPSREVAVPFVCLEVDGVV